MDWLRKRSKRGNSTSPKGGTDSTKPDNAPDRGKKDAKRSAAEAVTKPLNLTDGAQGSSAVSSVATGTGASNRASSSPRSKRKGKSVTPKSTSASPQPRSASSSPSKPNTPPAAASLSPADGPRHRSATRSESSPVQRSTTGLQASPKQSDAGPRTAAQRAASVSSSQPIKYEHLQKKTANSKEGGVVRRTSKDKTPSPSKTLSKSPGSEERPQTVWEKPDVVAATAEISEDSFGLDSRRASEDSLSSKLGISFGTGFSSVSPSPDRLPIVSEDSKPARIPELCEQDTTASDLRDLLTGPKRAVAPAAEGASVATLSDVTDAVDPDVDIEGLTKEIEQLQTSYHYATIKSDGTLKSSAETVSDNTATSDGTVCMSTGETIARYLTSRSEQTNPFAKELGEHQRQVDMFISCSDTMLTHLLKFLDSAWADDLAVVHKHFDDEREEIERLIAEKTSSEGTTTNSSHSDVGDGKGEGSAVEGDVPDDVTELYDTVNADDTVDGGADDADDVAIQALLEREARVAAGLSLEADPLEGVKSPDEDGDVESYQDCTIRPGEFAAAKQVLQDANAEGGPGGDSKDVGNATRAQDSSMGSPEKPEHGHKLEPQGNTDGSAIHNGDDGVDDETDETNANEATDGGAAVEEDTVAEEEFVPLDGHGLRRGAKHKSTVWMKPKRPDSQLSSTEGSPTPLEGAAADADTAADAGISPTGDRSSSPGSSRQSDDPNDAPNNTPNDAPNNTPNDASNDGDDNDIPEELPKGDGLPGKGGTGGEWVSLSSS